MTEEEWLAPYHAHKLLPGGKVLVVQEMAFHKGRLYIGTVSVYAFDDGW